MPPMVDMLYFCGAMILVIGMAIFIVRVMRSKDEDGDASENE